METVRVVCGHDCPDMCSLIAHVDNGKIARVTGDPDQPLTAGFACARVNRDAELVHSPGRLQTPLKRRGAKGTGDFVAISWDEAFDEIETRWKAIIAEHGPSALLGYAYSAHQGQMNRGIVNGFFHALGTSRLQAGTVCDTCCETAWDMTVGPIGGVDPETVSSSDLIISWGCDLVAVNVHLWQKIEFARRKGVKLIVIDPRRSRTAERADWHIPIKIGTDAALALGIMHILVRDNLCDRAYLEENTIGFDKLEAETLPRFTPSYVADVTGLSVDDVERLAAMYGKAKASFIRIGEGMSRLANGGQAIRAVCVLPALTGAYGRRGGGALLLTAASLALNFNAIRKPSGPATARMVNQSLLGDALLNMTDPPLYGLYVSANNPAVTCPEAHKVRQGLLREDLFTVVHDPFMSATGRYADIVLPSTTYLETEDFFRAYGAYYMQYAPRAIAPVFEARSNLDVVRELAKRMGLTDPIFSMSQADMLGELFKGVGPEVPVRDPKTIMSAGPIALGAPDAQKFATPSGKLEIYSAALAAQGVSPMPTWQPDAQEIADAKKWPLRLLTAPGYFLPHTAFENVAFLRNREGPVGCVLHPDEAARRRLADKDRVMLHNEHGRVTMIVRVSDEVPPGVVLVPGQRTEDNAGDGTINMLCSGRFTDIGEGATYQSTFLDVSPATLEAAE